MNNTGLVRWIYSLVNVYITTERSATFNGKSHYTLPFSITMFNYQRVMGYDMDMIWIYDMDI